MRGVMKRLNKTVLASVGLLMLLAGIAHSQESDSSKSVVDPDSLYQNKVLDRQYQDTLGRQPDGKDAHDPWVTVRAAETPNKNAPKKPK